MKLDIHRTDNGATVTIRMGSNGSASRATSIELTGKHEHQYAMIDGMLWTLLREELKGFMMNGRTGAEHDEQATGIGNRLVNYMALPDFYTRSQEDAQHITRTITKNVPALAPLTHDRPELIAWHAHIQYLADLLKQRMLHVGDTWLGIDAMLKAEAVSA